MKLLTRENVIEETNMNNNSSKIQYHKQWRYNTI
jgi:hypothetical protein